MEFKGQDILSTKQFDKEGLLWLFAEARKMEELFVEGRHGDVLKGRVLATLFFEGSTRTRFSFETAMHYLGGRVISNADMVATSSYGKKRESLEDTGKVVSRMSDLIVMRHPEPGSVAKLALKSDVPVINAGDGPSEHPTQGLLDLYTIWKEHGELDGLTVGVVGDLRFSRVAHSECDLLKHFDVNFIFVSPEGLKMPDEIVEMLKEGGHKVRETDDFEGAIGEMDVISMTRIQEERFETKEEYKKYEGVYILDVDLMHKAKEDSIIIQPLPRVDEVAIEVDDDHRAKYFDQIENGVAIRMALMAAVLGKI